MTKNIFVPDNQKVGSLGKMIKIENKMRKKLLLREAALTSGVSLFWIVVFFVGLHIGVVKICF